MSVWSGSHSLLKHWYISFKERYTSWYRQIFKEIEEYVVTDMSIDEMERLSGYEMKKTD